MMKKTLLALTAISMAVPATAPTFSAQARHHYTSRHYYTTSNGIRYWRGNDGRYYCHRSNGTVGLLVGAAAGALVGRAIDTHGSRATGTIVGAAAGALLGRSVARNHVTCR
jgi:outer membrane lipoprotein SlyB